MLCRLGNGHGTLRARAGKRATANAPEDHEFDAIQTRLLERVRKAMEIIQFGLDELNEFQRSAERTHTMTINRKGVMDALESLKKTLR
jgi:hypothetical protein